MKSLQAPDWSNDRDWGDWTEAEDRHQEFNEEHWAAVREKRDQELERFVEDVLQPAMKEAYEHFKTLPPCTDPTCSAYGGGPDDTEGGEK